MKAVFLIFVVVLLCRVAFCSAEQGWTDELTPVYQALNLQVLPGMLNTARHFADDFRVDFSDASFLLQAKCSYLSWVIPHNRYIRSFGDSAPVTEGGDEEGYFDSDVISRHCNNTATLTDQPAPESAQLTGDIKGKSYFPVKSVLKAMDEAFSPFSSDVQAMPSYEVFYEPEQLLIRIREAGARISMEYTLFILGSLARDTHLKQWADDYISSVETAVRDFHCNRFFREGEEIQERFNRCLESQSSQDLARSDHAGKLKLIAVGEWRHSDYGMPDLEGYGYAPGYAFAASLSQGAGKWSYSMVVPAVLDILILALLVRRVY